MVRDLIINVSILISFVSIASHLMKERDINAASPAKVKLATGLSALYKAKREGRNRTVLAESVGTTFDSKVR